MTKLLYFHQLSHGYSTLFTCCMQSMRIFLLNENIYACKSQGTSIHNVRCVHALIIACTSFSYLFCKLYHLIHINISFPCKGLFNYI